MPETAEATQELNLEQLTNEAEGWEEPASPEAPEPSTEEGAPQPETAEAATPEPEASQAVLSDEDKSLLDEIRALSEIQGTPFKNVKALIDGYKNLQGEFTKTREKTKPYEAVLNRMSTDPQFSGLVAQLQQMVDNPHLLQAYAGQQLGGDPQPNPANYDVYTPEGLKKYNEEMSAWVSRQMDSRFNTLKSEIETNARLDNWRREFQGKYSDVQNPDEFLQWGKQVATTMNPYEVAYKLKNWDNAISQAEAKVRKELTAKMQEATKTKTPQGSTAKTETSATEVIQHLARYGKAATDKRFGAAVVEKALQYSTLE